MDVIIITHVDLARMAEPMNSEVIPSQLEYLETIEREAVERQTAAASEESKFRKAAERKKARLRTQIGKAGILPIGSVELVAEKSARELEIDALNIRRGGQIGAQALAAEATLSRLSGRSALLRGKAARRAGRISAFATGLSGASQLTFAATET